MCAERCVITLIGTPSIARTGAAEVVPWRGLTLPKSALVVVTLACMLLTPAIARAANDAAPFPVDVWEPPFNQQRQHVRKEYTPLAHAAKPWRLCVSIPHLKDDY